MKTVIIVGGGMSGLAAAVTLSEQGMRVTVLERQDRVGKKIYLTGNGKCNLSNKNLSADFFVCDSPGLVQNTIKTINHDSVLQFWNQLGVLTKEKNGGIYPYSNQAATVVNALVQRCEKNGVKIFCNSFAEKIKKAENDSFIVRCKEKAFRADYVILACGGMAGVYKEESNNGYRLAKSLGHTVNYCYPALVQTVTSENLKEIHGVRCDGTISLFIAGEKITEETGELQFTEKFVSGIPVFQLSRYIKNAFHSKEKVELIIDLIGQSDIEWQAELKERVKIFEGYSIKSFYNGILNEKLNLYFINKANLKPDYLIGADVSAQKVISSAMELLHWKIPITGVNSFKNAQISTGGIPCQEVDETFHSHVVRHLYITGEMLDAAGACGGYNLYFAAASGIIAASSILSKINNI